MQDSLLYIMEVALCLNLLYWVYRQFLSELSFFSWSRFFFIIALLTAFAVPTFELPLMPYKVSPKTFFAYAVDGSDQILFFHKSPVFESSSISRWFIKTIFMVYVTGAIFFLFKIIKQIVTIYRTKNRLNNEGIRISSSSVPAWSFFNRIIINEKVETLEREEKAQVLVHEKTHAKQLHSIDTVMMEVATALLWFNPLMPKIKREMVSLHEYLADSRVVKQFNTQHYSRLILKLSNTSKAPSVGAAFTNQMVGTRIKMLNRPPQSQLKKLRFLMVIPFIVVVLVSFSLTEHVLLGKVKPSALSNSKWKFPLTEQFAVVKPFRMNEIAEWGNMAYHLSHKRVTIVAEAHQNVLSLSDAQVLNVWRNEKSGVNEIGIALQLTENYVFVIEGLESIYVSKGEQLEQGQKIGITGKLELYPSLKFELWDGGKRIDPLLLFE